MTPADQQQDSEFATLVLHSVMILLIQPLLECRTAVAVADQQQDSEIANLRTVILLANETLVSLLNATVAANYTSQLTLLDSQIAANPSNVSCLWC